jgi:alcohol dehydrogenase (cytochrome c)
VWRFWSIPLPGEPGGDTWPTARAAERGGAAGWLTGTYDPELNLVYWPLGNPNPDYDGNYRRGDNLYSNSLVALDADTGKLRWHFQFTPWDEWDYDSTQTPILADLTIGGTPRKVVMQANRNGFFYVLDRTNGQFLLGKPYVKVTWASGLSATGRPIETPNNRPTLTGNVVCPNSGTNWYHPSFDPATGLFYVNAREGCRMATNSEAPRPETYEVGERPVSFGKSVPLPKEFATNTGLVLAIDPTTGARKWESRYGAAGSWAGVLTTASGVLFTGDNDGHVLALDSRTGKELWRQQLGGAIYAAPTTYMLDGRQYVSISAGTTFTTFALPGAQGQSSSR